MVWFTRSRTFAAIALLVWAAYRAYQAPLAEDRRLVGLPARESDPIDAIDRRYQDVTAALPVTGVVGYLTPASGETYGGFYVAEYALTPRIVVPSVPISTPSVTPSVTPSAPGADAEFVIVPPEALAGDEPVEVGSSSRDPRLQGFLLYRAFESGVRIFRRVR